MGWTIADDRLLRECACVRACLALFSYMRGGGARAGAGAGAGAGGAESEFARHTRARIAARRQQISLALYANDVLSSFAAERMYRDEGGGETKDGQCPPIGTWSAGLSCCTE